MDDYLSKPVLLEDLRAALSRGVRTAVPAPTAAVSSGDGDAEPGP